jgi:hypothetical protein
MLACTHTCIAGSLFQKRSAAQGQASMGSEVVLEK